MSSDDPTLDGSSGEVFPEDDGEDDGGSGSAPDSADAPTIDGSAAGYDGRKATALPDSIGPFRILSRLGEGGMGVVYEAEQAEPRRRVALKVVRAGAFANEAQLRMFQREADMLARLKHPGIAAIHQVGHTEEGQPYLVMELVRGLPLDDYLKTRPPVDNENELGFRLKLFRRICEAVQHAHQRGIIHRDLKPANVLVTEALESASQSGASASDLGLPQIKVLDFGLARAMDAEATQVTEVGMIKGTLQYMSPEQTRGRPEDVDTRADVYSLGMLLYQMLTGDLPYDLQKAALSAAMKVICEQDPLPMTQSWSGFKPDPDIHTIVGKALEKEPERRYTSPAALSDDIDRYLVSQPILARPPSAVYQIRKMIRRHRAAFGFAAMSAVALVVATVVSATMYVRAERSAEEARTEAEKSSEVSRFMSGLLQSVGPSVAQGRDTELLEEVLENTVKRIDEELEGSPEVSAILKSYMGEAYFDMSNMPESERLYRESLELLTELNGPDDEDTLRVTSNLALNLTHQTQIEEAEQLWTTVIEGRKRSLGPRHGEVANALAHAADLYTRKSEYKRSEEALREALEILREQEDPDQQVLGITMNTLGNALHHQGEFDQAEALYREALQIHTDALGPTHPDVLVDLHNLAYVRKNKGDFRGAEEMFLEVIETQKKIYGADDHHDVARTIQSLGGVRQSAGDFDGAKARYLEALDMLERLDGPESAAYARALNDLGVAADLLGEDLEGETYLRESLRIRRKIFGDIDDSVASTRGNLAALLIGLKKYDEAAEQLTEAIRVQNDLIGPDHPQLGILRTDLGRLYVKLDRNAEGEAILRDVLDKRLARFGEEHALTGRSYYEVATVLTKSEDDARFDEGIALFHKSIASYTASKGPDYPAVPITKQAIANNLHERGRYAEAEPLFLEAQEGLEKSYGAEHPRAVRNVRALAELYEAWNEAEPDPERSRKAAEWRARVPTEEG